MNGYNIIMDSNSGAVHSVDEMAYDIISMYEDNSKSEIITEIVKKHGVTKEDVLETISEIEGLKDEKLLFSKDPFEEAAMEFKNRQSVLKAICLHVAHACNMDCKYCFAGKGDYSGKSGIMSLEVGKQSLDFLVKNSGTRHNLEVDLFGGEPLLNWDVCKGIVEYGRELEKKYDKKFNFTLTTNGILLNDEIIEYTTKEMGNVVISLDGRKRTHDFMRQTKDGGGTYEKIIDNFKKLADAREQKEYYMRGTYTAYNKDFANDILHMADLGFKETAMEPVVGPPDADYTLKDEDVDYLCEQYEKLALEMLKREEKGEGFNFYHYTIDLTGGPCIVKRVSGCGVGTEYLAVTPTGDLYPCHQFVGQDDFCVGNIYEGVTNKGVIKQFETCNVYSHKECKDCFAKLYCAGGCAANAYFSKGDINEVYELGCKLHRKRIECAIMMKVAEEDKGLKRRSDK
jgi:uncharacterized protein